jgi:hypothetical protein
MISPNAHNKMKEETRKNHPKIQNNTHGRKEEEKKFKGNKKNINIKAKGKCKSNGKFNLLHLSQRNLLLQQQEK